jgi:hypothetical protein
MKIYTINLFCNSLNDSFTHLKMFTSRIHAYNSSTKQHAFTCLCCTVHWYYNVYMYFNIYIYLHLRLDKHQIWICLNLKLYTSSWSN